MLVGQLSNHTSARCTLYETFHYKEWLINLLNGSSILTDSCSDGSDTHRTSAELIDDGEQNLVIDFVETILIDIKCCQGNLCDLGINHTITLNLRKVAHTAQQRIGDTWRSTRTTSYLECSIFCDGHAQYSCRALYDSLQCLGLIILQVHVDTESCTQRSCQQSTTCGSTHQRKWVQVYLYASCRWTFVYHNIDAVILHRTVQIFLYHRRQAVDLVDKQHIVLLERSQYACQIARFV